MISALCQNSYKDIFTVSADDKTVMKCFYQNRYCTDFNSERLFPKRLDFVDSFDSVFPLAESREAEEPFAGRTESRPWRTDEW
jgi:hypothetical protein